MKLGQISFDSRKWEVNRREVNEAYKKNKAYNVDSKKQMVAILENLLGGENDNDAIENANNHLESALQEESYTNNDQKDLLDLNNMEDIKTLEEVRNAALSIQNPSLQDLQIAIVVSNQINQIKKHTNESTNGKSEFKLDLLERLKNQFYMKNDGITFESHEDVKQMKQNKKFQTAISKYKTQMEMAQYNFEMEMPTFTSIA